MQKHLIILQHNSGKDGKGELANQLWNYMSIVAYAYERGYTIENRSFFEYQHLFTIPPPSRLIWFIFFAPFPALGRLLGHTRATIGWRRIYKLYVITMEAIHTRAVLRSYSSPDITGVFYLPPSEPVKPELMALEKNPSINMIYFDGWLFRNPVGIQKYHKKIMAYFQPKKETQDTVQAFMAPLRNRYDHIIGVHIRQGDYKTFKGGKYFMNQTRIRAILDEYISEYKKDPQKTCFIITSNGSIDKQLFDGLHITVSRQNFIEDLFILASCDIIIGSDSSFSAFAAYYGNIPHVIFKNDPIDWQYYRGETRYFQNRYCTLVHF